MSKANFQTLALRLTAIILLAGAVVCLLALCYFAYYYGFTGQRQFTSWRGPLLYYVFPAVLAALLFTALTLKPAHQIIVATGCLSLAASGYGIEVFLRLSDSPFFEPEVPFMSVPKNERKKIAARLTKQFGVEIDTRDQHEVIFDLRKQGIDAVPLIWKLAINADLLPLGAISNKVTVVCNQNGKYLTYKSDEHGFHNPPGIWQPGHIDIAAVGNSFAFGYCVPSDRNFVGLIRRRHPATLNLAMTSQGPLQILATLREYALFLKPKLVLWFYSEANSFTELRNEKQKRIPTLYLKEDFTQRLLERQYHIDQALTSTMDRQTAPKINQQPRTQGKNTKVMDKLLEFTKMSVFRQKLGLIYGIPVRKPEELSGLELSQLEMDMDLFRDALSKAKTRVNAGGGKLYFVYLPSWERYAKYSDFGVGVKARTRVLTVVHSLGIPLIDNYPAFQAHADPLSLFPFRGPGHYNEEAHRLVAETVLKAIELHGSSD